MSADRCESKLENAESHQINEDQIAFGDEFLEEISVPVILAELSDRLGCEEGNSFLTVKAEDVTCSHVNFGIDICTVKTAHGTFFLSEDFGQPENANIVYRPARKATDKTDCQELISRDFHFPSQVMTVRSPTPNGLKNDTEKTLTQVVQLIADEYGCPADDALLHIDGTNCITVAGEPVCMIDTAAGFLLLTDGPFGTLRVAWGLFD